MFLKNQQILIIIVVLFFYFIFYEYLKLNFIMFLVIKRGIITPDKYWWSISDNFLNPHVLNDFFYNQKKKYPYYRNMSTMFGNFKIITDFSLAEYILLNSPFVFGPGKVKTAFFNNFMSDNVGISLSNEWKIRRKFNEDILNTSSKIHELHSVIWNIVNTELCDYLKNVDKITFDNLRNCSRNIALQIVFGYKDERIYDIFKGSNDITSIMYSKKNKKNKMIHMYIQRSMNNKESLIGLINEFHYNDDYIVNIADQVPHWLFPMTGLINIMLLRLLYLITANSCYNFYLDVADPSLNNVILESLRLNNPVVTFFRKCLKDSEFSGISFKKNEEILILANPLLRNPEVFQNPNIFDPDRWNDDRLYKYLIMFGLGRQTCPGRNLSLLILKYGVISVFSYLNENGKKLISNKIFDVPDMMNPFKIEINIINNL